MTMTDAMRHLQMAEVGKLAALRGDHVTALGHYRDAMRLAVAGGAPEVFFRHYLEATLESLELMNAFDNVLEYCDRAIRHYAEHPPEHEIAWLDLASIHQRRGAVLLKSGNRAEARAAFACAVELANRIGASLELAQLVLGWLTRGLVVSTERLLVEQRRLRYFSIRADADDAHSRGHATAARQREAADPERTEVLSA
jgi:tetratricopeptide (TPR) repeat protein